jgi:hypothetical protein
MDRLNDQKVGWVERSDTHHQKLNFKVYPLIYIALEKLLMGIVTLNPSYA